MKSYTDLGQSKNLSNILPLTSADMHYERAYFEGKQSDWFIALGKPIKSDDIIPCWSLTALLEVIPQEIFDGEYIINITEGSDNRWILTYDHYENIHSYYGLSIGADNLVDACYKMVIRLSELKMM